MVTHGLHIVGYPTLTGLLCNSVPITSLLPKECHKQDVPSCPQQCSFMDWSALYKQPCLAVSLSVPWEHLMVVMSVAPCVLSLLSGLALSPEVSWDKRFGDAQEEAREHCWPGVPSNSTAPLQRCSLVVAKPDDNHLSHMHSVICCCSGYFLASFFTT